MLSSNCSYVDRFSHVILYQDLHIRLTLMQLLIDTTKLEGGISFRELFRLFLLEVGIARSTFNAPRSCNMADTIGLVPNGDAQVSPIFSTPSRVPSLHEEQDGICVPVAPRSYAKRFLTGLPAA